MGDSFVADAPILGSKESSTSFQGKDVKLREVRNR